MNTVPEIIDQLGGTTAFGRAIAVKQSAASEMKRRKSIPVTYWPKVIEAATALGKPVTYDDLVRIHVEKAEGSA